MLSFSILFMVSFAVHRFLCLIKCHLLILGLISVAVRDGSRKTLLQFMSKSVLPMFSSKSFIVSGFTLRSLIHFELNFVHGIVRGSTLTEATQARHHNNHLHELFYDRGS